MASLGFGLERLGLVAVRWPKATAVVVVIISVLTATGIPKLSSDDALSELFRSDTKAFENYKTLSDKFPTSEFDVLVVVEGENLVDRDLVEEIRTLHLELSLATPVEGVLSMFSMRDPPAKEGLPPPMFPAELPEGEAFKKLMERAESHPLIGDKLLSKRDKNGQLALLVISLKDEIVDKNGLNDSIKEIETLAHEVIDPTGLSVKLAGAPVMQLEVRNAIKRDRLIFNSAGFLVGFAICFAFFRRPKLATIAAICPGIAVLWGLGTLGHIGLKLNTFLNAIPPLVMVIALSDALHMVYSIRRQVGQGKTREEACRYAIMAVGPACVLTSITTSLALITLALTDSAVIRTFGICAAIATGLAFVVVITIVPMLSLLWLGDEEEFRKTEKQKRKALALLEDYCSAIARWIEPRHWIVTVVGVLIVAGFAAAYGQLKAQYRLSDQLPVNKQATAAAERLDIKLTGAIPIHIMVRWPNGKTIEDEEVLEVIAEAHKLLEEASGIGNVWSVETLKRWLSKNLSISSPDVVADYVRKLPAHLSLRFVNEKADSVVVTGRIPNLDAEETVPIVDDLDAKLNRLRQKHEGYEFYVTGLAALSSLQAASMIEQLNRGLIVAVIIVIILIGVAFRSFYIMALSVIPNLFPILAAGALLYFMGGGLEYASVIALTVAFGLAVDDTIHFLNRLKLEQSRTSNMREAVYETIVRVGPVLVLTTIVLVMGMAVTIFSELPPMQLFGQLSMTTLTAAVIGDLLLLPAIILFVRSLRAKSQEA